MINEHDLEAFDYYTAFADEVPKDKTPMQLVEEYRVAAGQPKDANLMSNLVDEEYVEWSEVKDDIGYGLATTEDELKELADLVYVIYGYANARNWNLDEALKRVHENNMGRMYQEDGTIKRREDGKITKRPGYPKVNLEDLV